MLIRELLPELDDEQFRRLETYVSSTSLLERLGTASNTPDSESIVRLSAPVLKALGPTAEPSMFHALIAQLAEGERDNVERAVAASGYAAPSRLPLLVSQFLENLTARLTNFYLRPLVAHIKKISSQGLLHGSTPEERYEDYCRRWGEEFSDDFYASYPLLPGVHGRTIEQFHAMIAEIFERVSAREDDVRELLNVKDDEPLKLESFGLPRTRYGGGRAGCLLEFTQGMVVYKSRNVEGEWVFWKIVQDLAAQGAPSMRAARVIRGDGYGFMEFIKREDADFYAEDFLGACGRLAALLYTLQAKDLHAKNLIPLRTEPVPIDLETILHPVHILTEDIQSPPEGSVYLRWLRGIACSAFLPTRRTRRDISLGFRDVGFLHGEQGTNPFHEVTVANPFRDDAVARINREPSSENPTTEDADRAKEANASTPEERRISEAARARAFARGFTQMYRWVCEHREIMTEVVRTNCSGLTLRALLQSTRYYTRILKMLSSPEALASEEVFATIALRAATLSNNRPLEMIGAEVEALWRFDIPFFMHRTDGSEIISFDGHAVGLTIDSSALDETLEHIAALGEDDLEEQMQQIWSAFVSPYPPDRILADASAELLSNRQSVQHERELCESIADRLTATNHPGGREEDAWTWLAPTPGLWQQHLSLWNTEVLGIDFYTGSTGAALALTQAARMLGKPEYTQTARRVLDPIAQDVFADRLFSIPPETCDGISCGETGIAFALAAAAENLQDTRFAEAAVKVGNRTAARLAQVQHPMPGYLDHQVGAAALLLGYNLATDRAALLAVLDRHAQDIIAGMTEENWWHRSGFAYGISGSIFALARWNHQMPSPERAREAVEILLRRLNDFNTGDEWRAQLTEHDSGEEHASGTWCSGSAGIALAFAALHLWMPELASRTDLDRAVQHAFRTGTRSNLTLCHGDFGTLDALAWIADRIPDVPCAEAIRDAIENGYSASDIRAVLDDKSVRYSLTPSFMVGTSGVLSWLARRADNARPYSPLIPEPFEVR